LIFVTFSIAITGHSRNPMGLIWIHFTDAMKCCFLLDYFQFDQFGPTFPEIFILGIVIGIVVGIIPTPPLPMHYNQP